VANLSWRSLAALSGLAFALLDAIALFLPGSPPRASETSREIAATLASHRGEVLVGMYVAGASVIALLFFLGWVRGWLARERADEGPTTVAIGGAIVGMGAQLVGLLLFYGAAYQVAGQHQDAIVRALTDGGNAAVEISKFGFAALIVGICLAGRRALPTIVFRIGMLSAAVLTVSAISLFSEGHLTQFGGAVDIAGAAPAMLWLPAFSVALFRREARAHDRRGVKRTPLAAS
jgi:hypothetical protein